MFDLLWGALRGLLYLLWEGIAWVAMDLFADSIPGPGGPSVSDADFAEQLAAIDPCGLGHENANRYSQMAGELSVLAKDAGARTQRRCMVILRDYLDERGCPATPLDVRRCARTLAAQAQKGRTPSR